MSGLGTRVRSLRPGEVVSGAAISVGVFAALFADAVVIVMLAIGTIVLPQLDSILWMWVLLLGFALVIALVATVVLGVPLALLAAALLRGRPPVAAHLAVHAGLGLIVSAVVLVPFGQFVVLLWPALIVGPLATTFGWWCASALDRSPHAPRSPETSSAQLEGASI